MTDQYFLNWILWAGARPEPAACIQQASPNSSLRVFGSRRAFLLHLSKFCRPWELTGLVSVHKHNLYGFEIPHNQISPYLSTCSLSDFCEKSVKNHKTDKNAYHTVNIENMCSHVSRPSASVFLGGKFIPAVIMSFADHHFQAISL